MAYEEFDGELDDQPAGGFVEFEGDLDDTSRRELPAGVRPSAEGAGRGAVNPPLAADVPTRRNPLRDVKPYVAQPQPQVGTTADLGPAIVEGVKDMAGKAWRAVTSSPQDLMAPKPTGSVLDRPAPPDLQEISRRQYEQQPVDLRAPKPDFSGPTGEWRAMPEERGSLPQDVLVSAAKSANAVPKTALQLADILINTDRASRERQRAGNDPAKLAEAERRIASPDFDNHPLRGALSYFEELDQGLQKQYSTEATQQFERLKHANSAFDAIGKAATGRAGPLMAIESLGTSLAAGGLGMKAGQAMAATPWFQAGGQKVAQRAADAVLRRGGTQQAAQLASQQAATIYQMLPGAAAMAGADFVLDGVPAYDETLAEVSALPEEAFARSQAYQDLRKQGLDHTMAARLVAKEAASRAFLMSGGLSALASPLNAGMEMRAASRAFTRQALDIAENLNPRDARRVALSLIDPDSLPTAMALEFAQEAAQSGGAKLGQNLAQQQTVDPEKDVTQGVAAEAGVGGVVGALMGGAMKGGTQLAERVEQRGVPRETSPSVEPVLGLLEEPQPVGEASHGAPTQDVQVVQEQPQPAGDAGSAAPPVEAPAGDFSGLAGDEGPTDTSTLIATPLDEAAHAAATSPTNDRPEPTDAQKEAGNYAKGHVRISGLDVSIENPKGSPRRSKADAPEPWEVTMPAHYGYIRGTKGADGDHVDLFIGDRGDNGRFWVINQHHADQPEKFDEHKVVTGVDSADEAVALYKASFADGFGDKVFTSVSGEVDAPTLKGMLPDLEKPKPVEAAGVPEPDVPAVAAVPAGAPDGGRGDGGGGLGDVGPDPGVADGVDGDPAPPAPDGGAPAAVQDGRAGDVQRVIARVGVAPAQAQPLELRTNPDGTMTPWFEGYEVLDYDSGDPVRLSAGTSDADAIEAVKAAGSMGKVRFFPAAAPAPAPAAAAPVTTPAAASLVFQRNDDGTLLVLGEPAKIREALPGIPGIAGKRGVTYGKTKVKAVLKAMEDARAAAPVAAPTKADPVGEVVSFDEWKPVGNGYHARSSTTHPLQEIRTPEGNVISRGLDTNGKEYFAFESGHNPLKRGGMAWVDKAKDDLKSLTGLPALEAPSPAAPAAAATQAPEKSAAKKSRTRKVTDEQKRPAGTIPAAPAAPAQAAEAARGDAARTEGPANAGSAQVQADGLSTDKPASKSKKPRMGESADAVWKAIKQANGGVVVEGRVLYPTLRVVAGDDYQLQANGKLGVVDKKSGGIGIRDATKAEVEEFHKDLERDAVQVVVLTSPGYGSGYRATRRVLQELHSPSGLSYEGKANKTTEPKFSVAGAPDVTDTPAFKRWFGDSKVVEANGKPRVMYHGTSASFNRFEGDKNGLIFVTPDPAFAERFASARHAGTGAPNVMPVYVKALRPFDHQEASHRSDLIGRLMEMHPTYTQGDGQQALLIDGRKTLYTEGVIEATLAEDSDTTWQFLETPSIVEAVERAGFDSMYVTEDGIKNLALFDPAQLKSATGNRGTFDPNSSDIRFTQPEASGKLSRTDLADPRRLTPSATHEPDPDPAVQRIVADFERRIAKSRRGFRLASVAGSDVSAGLRGARALARGVFGHQVIFVHQPSGRLFNGAVGDAPGQDVVFIDVDSDKPAMAVLGHELLHRMRATRPDLYDGLRDRLLPIIKGQTAYNIQLSARRDKADLVALTDDALQEELIADVVGDEFAQPEFWRTLAGKDRSWFRRVADFVMAFFDDLIDKVKRKRPFGTDQYLSDIEAARAAVADVMAEFSAGEVGTASRTDAGPRYSLANKTPDQRAALERAGLGGPRKTSEKLRTYLDRALGFIANRNALAAEVRQGALDQFHGIDQAVRRELGPLPVEQDPYIAARLANGGTSSVMRALLLHGQAVWAANGQHLDKKPGTKGLLEILAPLGDDLNDWFGWMIGNRAARLAKEGRENNFTAAQIKALQDLPGPRLAEFQKAAAQYAEFKRSVLDVAQAAGLIDPEGRKAWDYADYIPFYRQIDERETFSGSKAPGVAQKAMAAAGRKGLAGQTSGIRTLKGGENALNDPMENLLMNFSRLIDASLKNNALRKTIEALKDTDVVKKVGYDFTGVVVPRGQIEKELEDAGTPPQVLAVIPPEAFEGMAKMWAIKAPTDPDVVRVMVGGKPQFYKVNDPLLLRALTSFVPFDFPGVGVMRAFKRLLTATVTATPEFMLRNFTRDTMAAQMIARDGFNPAKSLAGIVKSYSEGGGFESMLFAGASFQSGNINAADPTGTAVAMRRALRSKGLNGASADSFMATVLDTPAKFWEKYRQVGEAIENANREAVYEAAAKGGKSPTAAAYEAKDLMDFTLRGSWAGYQLLADVLPFFNARVQGLYRLGRSNPKRLAAYGMLLAAASMALALGNAGEDWYEELPDWDKDNFWHFKIGQHHWRLPKPFELGVVFATIPERIMRYIKEYDRGSKTTDRLWANVRDQLAFDPVPQMIRPGLNAWSNRNTFRDAPIEGMADEGKLPHARYSASTSATARVALDNKVVGPAADALGLSPKKLEYLVGGYLGTAGLYALGLSDMVVKRMEGRPPGPALRADDIPVVKAFYRVDPARGTVFESDLYKMREEVEQIHRTLNAYKDDHDVDRARQFAEDNKAKLGVRDAIVMTANQLKQMNKLRDQIIADKNLTPQQKREKLDDLQRKKNEAAKKTATHPAITAAF
jgi:hypothetical protein